MLFWISRLKALRACDLQSTEHAELEKWGHLNQNGTQNNQIWLFRATMIRICPFGLSVKTRKIYIVHIYQGKTMEHEIIKCLLKFYFNHRCSFSLVCCKKVKNIILSFHWLRRTIHLDTITHVNTTYKCTHHTIIITHENSRQGLKISPDVL